MTLWTAAHQASLSMEFSRQEYWSEFPYHPPRDLPNPEIEPTSLKSPVLAGGFFTTSTAWKSPILLLVTCVLCVLVTQSCLTLYDPMDCSPPGFSILGILQARILEWVAVSFSRGSSQPRDRTQVSRNAGRCLTSEPPGKLLYL